MTTDTPAPAPSAEARRLIDVLKECSGATGVYHLCGSDGIAADAHEDAADRALSAYVAGLEAQVAEAQMPENFRTAFAEHPHEILFEPWKSRAAEWILTRLRADAAQRTRAAEGENHAR